MKSEDIEILTESITLDGLLKWAGIVTTGGDAKRLIQSGAVKVDGVVETRRSRRVRCGNTVETQSGHHLRITCKGSKKCT